AHRLPLLLGGHHFFSATSWSICLSSASSATRRFSRAFSASNSLSLLASSCLRPPYWLRQRCRVCSLTPRRWQTWARLSPWARSASACRNLAMTSSGVCRFMDRLLAPQGLRDSHTTWTTFWGAGHLILRTNGRIANQGHYYFNGDNQTIRSPRGTTGALFENNGTVRKDTGGGTSKVLV